MAGLRWSTRVVAKVSGRRFWSTFLVDGRTLKVALTQPLLTSTSSTSTSEPVVNVARIRQQDDLCCWCVLANIIENLRSVLPTPIHHPRPKIDSLPTSTQRPPHTPGKWRIHNDHGVGPRQARRSHVIGPEVSIENPSVLPKHARLPSSPFLRREHHQVLVPIDLVEFYNWKTSDLTEAPTER